ASRNPQRRLGHDSGRFTRKIPKPVKKSKPNCVSTAPKLRSIVMGTSRGRGYPPQGGALIIETNLRLYLIPESCKPSGISRGARSGPRRRVTRRDGWLAQSMTHPRG